MMLGLPFAASPYAGALRHDPAQLKQRAFTVSRELLAVVRSMAHVVVLLEDLHWADPVSWEYLVQVGLEEAPARRGVFVLATARPEWNPPAALLGLPGYVQVNLASLPEAESQELARELLRTVEDTPPHVIQQVVERSEGVPYYAEELVNWFLDRGVIDRSRTPWRFDASRLGETPPPATLQHLLLTRLSALQDTERAALQRGSVFGRHFGVGGLGALGFPAAGRVLASLQPRNFVDLEAQSSLHGEAEWSFHHNILHQVIYESVLKRRRRAWHRQAAAWLEAQARQAGRLDEFVEVLGEHAERAGEPSAAADWFARAGERARDLGASVVARRFFDRALQLAPRDDLERRWRILLSRDEVLSLLGETQARLADDAALLHIAQALGEDARLAEAHYRHGGSLQNQGDDLAANRVFDAGLEYARRAGSRMLEAQLLGVKVVGLTRVGSLESVAETAQAALAALEPLEDDSLRAGVLFFEQQVAIHLRLGVLRDQLVGLSNLGYVSILLGRYAEGLRYIEQAQALAEKIGARRNAAYNQLNAGLAYTRQGDSRSACLVLEGAMADLAEIGDQFGQAAGRYYLGLALEQAGDFQAAAASYAQAVDAFRSLNAHAYATEAQAGLAHCALVRGDLAEAGRVGSQAWADLQKNGAQGMEFPIRAYLVCAQVFAALGNPADARQALELGCAELFQRADKISDPAWRASFIENIAEHRAILALQAALSS
jgi:tetratricopeptide (TPR) repeat protein